VNATWLIQSAAVERWESSAAVVALLGDPPRIYDGRAPQGAERPYVVIDQQTEVPANVLAKQGSSNTLTLSVVSAGAVAKEATTIRAALDAAVRAPVAVEGYGTAKLKPEFGTVLVEGDGTRRGVRRYRITTFAEPSV
jgi:hypothetical protein